MMTHILFERFALLCGLLIAVQFSLIGVWSWRRGRASGRAVWIGFAGMVVLPVASLMVTTTRERLMDRCGELARAVEREDSDAIDSMLSVDFATPGLDRAGFLTLVDTAFERMTVDGIELGRFDMETGSGREASVAFTVRCRVEGRDFAVTWLPTRWRLTFRRNHKRWIVTGAESIPIPPLNLRRIADGLR